MKKQLNTALKKTCESSVAEGVCTGVSAAISVVSNTVRYQGFFACGMTRSDHLAKPVNTTTLFDLASLTKPLCTTLCTLALIDAGLLNWESACLVELSNDLSSDKSTITIHNILHHASGLPAYQPYFRQFEPHASPENSTRLHRQILVEPLVHSPGSKCLYSDLGFILLGRLIEQRARQTLDRFFEQTITRPLQLDQHLRFLPVDSIGPREKEKTAATELCPWRHKLMQGEVDDEHCWLTGGVSGHAGLFGTAASVLSLGEWLLDCWMEKIHTPAFSNQLVRYALEWRDDSGQWALGFDRPTPGQSSSGRHFSSRSVGHLGFTGTSLWIDPERGLVVVLLTNRVHPSRENQKIRLFRPFFHDYLLEKTGMV
ncbi:MAG: beta-lactamase family protein [Desulfobulbus sp.]|nr:beta-lactamase family protein [Desulfobulbus sp.]